MKWYRKSELKDLPSPSWLVEGFLLARTLAQLSGPSKVGKTFVYTDWCCRLAVEGHHVAVLLGEGLYGMHSRIDAWERHHGLVVPNDNLRIRGGVTALGDPVAMGALAAELAHQAPLELIVLDTYARFMAGYNENDPADTSIAMENVESLRAAAGGATALLISHFGWDGTRQRGSSGLYGACDTVLYLKPVSRKPETPPTVGEDEMYLAPVDTPKSRRSRLTVDKHRDAPDEIEGVTYERQDVPGTGSCVYLPIKSAEKVVDVRSNGHPNGNGDGKVVRLKDRVGGLVKPPQA